MPILETDFRFRGSILTDGRYALRQLVRSPAFVATSVASLAIGIAAATTLFGLADALFLRPVPGIREADQVVEIERTTFGSGYGTLSYPIYEHLRGQTRTLQSIAATIRDPQAFSLSDGETSQRVYGTVVSNSFFDVLQLRPALGRFFQTEEDAVPDAEPVVVLSHRLWKERFQSAPGVLGRPVRINNIPFTVVGVVEAGFEGTTAFSTDLWVPMAMAGEVRGELGAELLAAPGKFWHRAVGRLRPGVTPAAAQAELATLLDAFRADTPEVPAGFGIRVESSGRLPPPARPPFAAFVGMLFILAGGLLAIACSNVTGMLLARATTRHREMATRLAMGAGHLQLVVQLLIETLMLFAAAALLALPLALWLTSLLEAFLPALPMPVRLDLSISLRTLLFAVGTALVAGLVFGLAPARHALRTDLSPALHHRSSTPRGRRLWLRHGLVAAQVAVSLATIMTAGLFVRTLQAAADVDSGFRTAGVEVLTLDTTLAGATGQDAVGMMDRVVENVRAVPGVEAVGHARMIPLQGGSFRLSGVRLLGVDEETAARLNQADWDVVSPDYFRAVGLPIVEGRAFSSADRDGQPRVAIVNEAFARAAWPGRSAVGQRFWQIKSRDEEGRPLEVVGVAKDAKYRTLTEAPVQLVYVPFAQQPLSRVELFVKHTPGLPVAGAARAAIADAEPTLPVVVTQSFDEAASLGLLPQRLAAWTAGIVGVIGVFLAALGLYGLAAFLVAHRTREIGIRMALGASRSHVRSLVLGQAARLGLAGAVGGVGLAFALGHLVKSLHLLVGVEPGDPLTFGGLVALMGAVLFIASYLPARRAASTDPAATLRAD